MLQMMHHEDAEVRSSAKRALTYIGSDLRGDGDRTHPDE